MYSFFTIVIETTFRELFPRASRDAVEFMSELLKYDPKLRISARQALKHPYLALYNNSSRPSYAQTLPPVEFMFENTVPTLEQLRDELLLEGNRY